MAALKKHIMTDGEIYHLINESIENPNNWTSKEIMEGKQVDVFPEWEEQLHKIIPNYKKSGWKLFWYTHGKREYLEFECPWKKANNRKKVK